MNGLRLLDSNTHCTPIKIRVSDTPGFFRRAVKLLYDDARRALDIPRGIEKLREGRKLSEDEAMDVGEKVTGQ